MSDSSAAGTDTPADARLEVLFARRCAVQPEAPAVVDADRRTLSYLDLERRAAMIARHLRSRGLQLGGVVGVSVADPAAGIIALLGTLKAGGVYLGLDPAAPLAQTAGMVRNAGVWRVLRSIDGLDGEAELPQLSDSHAVAVLVHGDVHSAPGQATPLSHQTALHAESPRMPAAGPGDRVLTEGPLVSRDAIGQLLATLLGGATAVIPDAGQLAGRTAFWDFLAGRAITHLRVSSRHLEQVVGGLPAPGSLSLKHVVVVGSTAGSPLGLRLARAAPGARIEFIGDAPASLPSPGAADGTPAGSEAPVRTPRLGGTAPLLPLFCIGAMAGQPPWFAPFDSLRERSRVIATLHGLDTSAVALQTRSMVEAASHLVARLLQIQPQGPYRLLGWSAGGLFAREMARQLSDAGQRVSLLAVIDTVLPGPGRYAEPSPLATARAIAMAMGWQGLLAGSTPPENLLALVDGARAQGLLGAGAGQTELAQALLAYRNTLALCRSYPPPPLTAPVLLMRALRRDPADGPLPDWGTASRRIETLDLPCRPTELLSPPWVGQLVDTLARRLALPASPPG